VREYTTPAVKELDPDTRLTDTVFTRAAQEPNAVMFRRLVDGAWRDVTCAEFHRDVMGVAKALIAAGINHGDRVALMSRTRYEWTVIDYAIWTIGGVTVPIFDTSSEEQVEWILRDSGSTLAFVENDEHAERVRAVSAQLLEPDRIVQIESDSFPAFVATGADVADSVVEERRAATGLDDLATLIYTSGTTGRPKGCELTQRNLAFDVMSVNSGPMKDIFTMEGRSTLLFLPLAHSLARIIQVGCVETKTVMGHFPSTGPDLLDALASFRPMFLLAVPRVFEKVYNKAEQKAIASGKGDIFRKAAETAIAYSKALDTGKVSLGLRLKRAVFSLLVYRKILAAVGGQAKYAVSGGSALGERLGHFFRGIGLTVLEGYGLTETSAPTTANAPDTNKIGTVGRPIPGTSIRIADDGEILVKGDNVMRGYWNNPKATKEAFTEDGWYRSGDIGELDEEGFLRITGRKKEIIVTAGGKNVAPAVIEDRIRSHAIVSQCMVVGDNRKFVAALITIDPEAFEFWKKQHNKTGTIAELVDDPDLRATVQKAVDDGNKAVSRAESVRKFAILPVDFSEAEGHMTASLKLKRHVIEKQFSAEIEALYAE